MGGLSSEVAFLSRALRMPRIRQVAPDVAKTARAEGWDPLELLVKVLSEEVTARETHGGENRIRAARFPQIKTPDNVRLRSPAFGVTSPDRPPPRFVPKSPQRDLLGPTRNRRNTSLHRSRGPSSPPRLIESRSLPPPPGTPDSPRPKHKAGSLKNSDGSPESLSSSSTKLDTSPFDPEAASLFFSLISSRYERRSLIVTSNRTSPPQQRFSATQSPSQPWSTA